MLDELRLHFGSIKLLSECFDQELCLVFLISNLDKEFLSIPQDSVSFDNSKLALLQQSQDLSCVLEWNSMTISNP